MKRIILILSIIVVVCSSLCPIIVSAAGVSVSVSPGAYPNQTTFNWSDNCYAIYGLFPKQFNIILDGTLVTSVSRGVNTYSMVVSPGTHTVTIAAPLSGTLTASASATFTVNATTYNIIYVGNGGTGIPPTQKKTHGTNIQLSDVIPTREGYNFLGWSTTGNNSVVEYNPGDIYDINSDLTLYALWEAIEGYIPYTNEDYFVFDGSAIDQYVGSDDVVRIPPRINGLKVREISEDAFNGNDTITTVILPDGVISVGDYAFAFCDNLETIELNEGLQIIGEGAFYGYNSTNKIKSIIIPSTVTEIEKNSFRSCQNLENVIFSGDNITTIGEYAFLECTKLSSITLPNSVTNMGSSVFEDCISLKSVKLSNGLTEIPSNCFNGCSSLTAIDIPDSVIKIGGSAFRECTSLSSVDLPNALQEISSYAFQNTSISEISLPQTVTSLGSGAFMGCTALKSIVIPSQVTIIPTGFASGCTSLSQIDIPYGVAEIKGKAFENCVNLTEIVIPDSVTDVRGFSGCSSLSTVKLSKNTENIGYQCFKNCTSLKNIEFPQSLKFIGESAFEGCSVLENIVLPTQLEEIDSLAFKDCSNLTNVTIPESVNRMGKQVLNNSGYYNNSLNWDGDVLYNGKWLLEAKTSISGDYTIKESTRHICSFAFNDCGNLTGIKFPYGIEHIPDNLFVDCTSLVNVEFPDTITSMEQAVFYSCDSLKSISLPDGIKSMGGWTFYMCSNLESVKLPYSITVIPERTFYNCTNLKNITVSELVTTIESRAFHNTNSLTDIYYSGTDWSNVTIGTYNTALDDANIHYNYSYTVLSPLVNIPSGEIESGTTIELSCLIDGATIYYATDGTEPNKSSLQYNDGITITGDTVIKAIAIKDGLADSSVATYTYSIKQIKPSLLDYTVTYKKTSSYYKFYLTFDEYVDNADLYLALYDSSGKMLTLVSEACEGDDYYIISVPLKADSVECRTFVWADNVKPIAFSKIVELD